MAPSKRGSTEQPYQKALTMYGLKEVVGNQDNEQIIQMFNDLGYNGSELKDETAWCAAFANWVLRELGYLYTGKLNARSFLELPGTVLEPKLGDIVIFWRDSPESWKGHVGFFINQDENFVYCLGGNQGNQLNIKPYDRNRVLGYRTPQKAIV
jgi:uncharacterized protein (TIGR02594 family)